MIGNDLSPTKVAMAYSAVSPCDRVVLRGVDGTEPIDLITAEMKVNSVGISTRDKLHLVVV